MINMEQKLDLILQKLERLDELKQDAAQINEKISTITEQVAHNTEQLNRIEQGQNLQDDLLERLVKGQERQIKSSKPFLCARLNKKQTFMN